MIGHMGIGDCSGNVMEFLGGGATPAPPGGLSFGPVCRYVQLPARFAQVCDWDEGVRRGCAQCEGREHMGCCRNCHAFVADSLNHMRYAGICCWNQVVLCFLIFFCGRFTTLPRGMAWAGPALVLAAVIAILHHLLG